MVVSNYIVKHAALTDVGLKRKANEDSIGFIELNEGYIFIVCDGMGGHEGGEIASKSAVRFIIESLNAEKIENATISLHKAITFANEQVFLTSQNRPGLAGMGTTLALLFIFKDEIYTAHVGDSRIYVLSDNNFLQLTKDHSVVQAMVDNGVLHATEAENHPRKNEITRAIGISENVQPSINSKPLKAKQGDRFILCSDGLSGLVSNSVFAKTVKDFKSTDDCVNMLIDLAKRGGGDDNISVQVVDIVKSPFTNSFYSSEKAIVVPTKKKINKGMLATSVIGGFLLLAGVGWGVFEMSAGDKENIKNQVIYEPKGARPASNAIEGWKASESTIDSVKQYLRIKKHGEDYKDYINMLKSSSDSELKYLIGEKVLSFNPTDSSYQLSSIIINKLKGDKQKNVSKAGNQKLTATGTSKKTGTNENKKASTSPKKESKAKTNISKDFKDGNKPLDSQKNKKEKKDR